MTARFDFHRRPDQAWRRQPAGWVFARIPAWHAAQLLALKVGPRPTPASPATAPDTESISWNRPRAALKKACSFVFSAGKGPPAPFVPPRGPGSVCARTLPAPPSIKQNAIDWINAIRWLHLFLDMIFPRVCPMLMGKPMDIRQPYTVELLSLCLNSSDALSDHFALIGASIAGEYKMQHRCVISCSSWG